MAVASDKPFTVPHHTFTPFELDAPTRNTNPEIADLLDSFWDVPYSAPAGDHFRRAKL